MTNLRDLSSDENANPITGLRLVHFGIQRNLVRVNRAFPSPRSPVVKKCASSDQGHEIGNASGQFPDCALAGNCADALRSQAHN